MMMTLAPALTWMHLLPAGARCDCAGAPRWFIDAMSRQSRGDGPPVQVAWGRPWHEVSDLPNRNDFVAINCPGVTTKRLVAAGFGYARRFAAVPSLAQARWFISLDTPAVAAASFSLYTPARRSAHLKKAAAKLAARLRLPMWYRDEIVIASRCLPPLEERLAKVFAGRDLRLALSAGAPEPARNRKASAVVIALNGEILGFVKIADSEISRRIVEHEASILPALSDRSGLESAAPRLIDAGELDDRFIAVQSPLPGKPAPPRLTPAHALLLARLRTGRSKLAAETRMLATIASRLSSLPHAPPELRQSLDALMPMLQEMQVPVTIVHGDFAPWNLRLHEGRISAFDWEYAELDGLPLIDETHFALQVGYLIEKWDLAAAQQALRPMADDRPLGLEPKQAQALQAVYLLDNVTRLLDEGYDADDAMIAWYRQLLTTLAAPRREAVLV